MNKNVQTDDKNKVKEKDTREYGRVLYWIIGAIIILAILGIAYNF